MRKIDLSP